MKCKIKQKTKRTHVITLNDDELIDVLDALNTSVGGWNTWRQLDSYAESVSINTPDIEREHYAVV